MPQDPTRLDDAATVTARFGVTRAQVEECLRIQQQGAAGVHGTITEETSDRLDALRGKPLSEILVARAFVPPAEKEKLDAAFAETAGAGGGRFGTLVPEDGPAPGGATGGCERRRFGKYELVRELGRGGMGVVYLAYHPALKTHFAVKVLLAGDDASAESVQRFHREAQTAAKLRHPGIVAVHDIGEEDGKTYFAMEYVEGTPLDRVLADPVAAGLAPATGPRGPAKGLPARVAARMTMEIAEAIQAAHDAGVIHRDLKPSNVLRDGAGRLRVMDFGLAKMVEGGEGKGTRTGSLMGTPSYMSPEQAEGRVREVDAQSDVYQLGAIFYDLLTGRPPYVAETPMEIVLEVMRNDPLAPRTLNPKIDRDAETICLAAMAREKSRRYASARALADDCRRWLDGEAIRARPEAGWEKAVRWVRRRKALTAVGAVALAALLAAGGSAWRASSAQQERERERTAREAAEREKAQLAGKILADLREKAGLFLDATLKLRRAGLPMSEGKEYLDKLAVAAAEAEKQDPKRPEPHFHLGRMHRALLRFDDALREQEAALAKDPAYAPSLYERAILRSMHYNDRLEALRKNWSNEEGLRLASLGMSGPGGSGNEAPRPLPSDEELSAHDPEAQSHRKVVAQDLESLSAAAPNTVAGLDPDLLECARAFQLLTFGGAEKRDQAIAALEHAVAGGKPNDIAYEAIALSHMRADGFEKAIETLTRGLERDKGYVPMLRTRAQCAWWWGTTRQSSGGEFEDQFQNAERDYLRAIELDPASAITHQRLGALYGDWAGLVIGSARKPDDLFLKADAELGKALELDPKNVDVRISRGCARMNLGLVLKNRGEDPLESYRKSEEDLQKALDADPKAIVAWLWLGSVRLNRASLLSDHGGDPEEAHAQGEAALARALEIDPTRVTAWIARGSARMNLALYRFQKGKPTDELYAQSTADLDRAFQLSPDPLILARRGMVFMNWGEPKATRGVDPGPIFEKAEVDLHKALEMNPRLESAWYGLGALCLNWGSFAATHGKDCASLYARAREAFEHALELTPADPRAWEGRAMLAAKSAQEKIDEGHDPSEEIARAEADYGKAIELDARSADAWLGRARVRTAFASYRRRFAADDEPMYERAIQDCSRALEINPNSAEVLATRGSSYLNLGGFLASRGRDPRDAYHRAAEDAGRALQMNPREAWIWVYHGTALRNQATENFKRGGSAGDGYVRAEADFSRALELNPLLVDAWMARAQARGDQAYDLGQEGRDPLPTYALAEADFAKALELNPKSAEGWINRGNSQSNLGAYMGQQNRDPRECYRKAIEDFTKAIDLAPGAPQAWVQRGSMRSSLGIFGTVAGEDPTEVYAAAEADLAKAVELAPDSADAWMKRGLLSYCRAITPRVAPADQARYLTMAVEDFTHSLRIMPAASEPLWRRGLAYFGLERWNDAIADFEAASKIDPACAQPIATYDAEARRRAGGGPPAEPQPKWLAPLLRGDQAVQANDYPAARTAYEEGLALIEALDAKAKEGLLAQAGAREVLMKARYNLACVESQASQAHDGSAAGLPKVSEEEAARLRAKAFEHLGAAIDLGWNDVAYLERDTDLAPLRTDPRWTALMQKAKAPRK